MTEFENYLGRETSWLKFNERVLEEAFCKSNPTCPIAIRIISYN